MPATGGIKQLHDLHKRLAWHEKQLEEGPRKIRVREKQVEKKEVEIAALKDQITEVQKSADASNLQYKTNEQKIVEEKVKLNQAASNKEFDIIKGQIASYDNANAELEDQYLELLEQVDAGQQKVAALEEEVSTAKTQVETTKQEIAEEEPKLRSAMSELEGEMSGAIGAIPSKLQEMYRRLVAAYGPEAFAPVENNACSECFVQFTPQENVNLRSGNVLLCRQCGRLIYLESDEAE